MTTREVADYLRLKERKIYDLVRARRIPCTRITGKWLFPKAQIDLWVAQNATGPGDGRAARPAPPPVVAGSHDPLLEWALRESQCALALMAAGSLDGLRRLAAREAVVAGMHVFDRDTGEYNVPLVRRGLPGMGVVVVEWAWRTQGLVLASGNPLGIRSLADLPRAGARVVSRQEAAGSQLLFAQLLDAAGVQLADLDTLSQAARSETDVAEAVRDGKADCGLAVAAAARHFGLDFLPLHRERYDLVLGRRDYFEPPVQALFAFARTPAFVVRAEELGGYDIGKLGRVVYNGP